MARTGADTDDLIGWSKTPNHAVFHAIRTWDAKTTTGVSRCGANLVSRGPRSTARPHERKCGVCFRDRVSTPPTRRRQLPKTDPAPIDPEHLRLSPDHQLVIRVETGDWIAVDLATGVLRGQISDRQARKFPTLRSRLPLVDLIGNRDLAAELDLTMPAIAHLQTRYGEEFPPANVRLAGRLGWWPERLPEIAAWNRARGGHTGGGKPSKNSKSD